MFYISLFSDSGTFILLTGWEANPVRTESLPTPFRWKANQFRRRVTAVVSNNVCMLLPISILDDSLWWMWRFTCPSYGMVRRASIWQGKTLFIEYVVRLGLHISCCCTALWSWGGANTLLCCNTINVLLLLGEKTQLMIPAVH